MLDSSLRRGLVFVVLVLFLVLFFCNDLSYRYDHIFTSKSETKFPDFSNSQPFWTLSSQEFPLDDPSRRVILVGDIHGMYDSLQNLLEKVSYDPSSDVLIPVGDFLTRGPHVDSMRTLSFMASNNITAVRGNHDQSVIEWRAWMHWINTQPGGARWLEETSAEWFTVENQGLDNWINKKKKKKDKWWKKIPQGWKIFDVHYAVAQAMSEAEYAYLRSLPYVIHAPNAHAFIVHGGLLASNPKHPYDDPRQPLASIPQLPGCCGSMLNGTQMLREIQERQILTKVPQNTVPWNVLNIRSLVDDEVTRESEGKPWSKAWLQDMQHCAGYVGELGELGDTSTTKKKKKKKLPCYPATVIYGHAAGRGLDVKRWSIGIDTGCVYERRLTALVLGGRNTLSRRQDDDDDDENAEFKVDADLVVFGDSHHGQIVSVRCP